MKPTLYGLDEAGTPVLLAGRCRCGHLFFPMQTYGCERCGQFGDAITATSLTGRGTLIASAKVHVHADKRRKPPFIIATIALDQGPIVRTLLAFDADAAAAARISAGARVHAVLQPVTGEDGERLDLRFELDA